MVIKEKPGNNVTEYEADREQGLAAWKVRSHLVAQPVNQEQDWHRVEDAYIAYGNGLTVHVYYPDDHSVWSMCRDAYDNRTAQKVGVANPDHNELYDLTVLLVFGNLESGGLMGSIAQHYWWMISEKRQIKAPCLMLGGLQLNHPNDPPSQDGHPPPTFGIRR